VNGIFYSSGETYGFLSLFFRSLAHYRPVVKNLKIRMRGQHRSNELNGWASTEFEKANFGDKRLTKRLVMLADNLAELPKSSIPTQKSILEGFKGMFDGKIDRTIKTHLKRFNCSGSLLHSLFSCWREDTQTNL